MEQVFAVSGPTWKARSASAFQSLRLSSPWLTWVGALMLLDIVVSLIGLLVDPTIITGAPAWLKPLKFAISTSLFCFNVAFMIGKLKRTRRFSNILGQILAVAMTLEIVLIDLQAARHREPFQLHHALECHDLCRHGPRNHRRYHLYGTALHYQRNRAFF
jgi:hypothetical protein